MLSWWLVQNLSQSDTQIDILMVLLTQRIHGSRAGLYVNSTIMVLLYNTAQVQRQDKEYIPLRAQARWESCPCDVFCVTVLLACFRSHCVFYATLLQLDMRTRDMKTQDSPRQLGVILNIKAGVNTRQKIQTTTDKEKQVVCVYE